MALLKIDENKILKYSDEDDVGYILEVDLEYPKDYTTYIRTTH